MAPRARRQTPSVSPAPAVPLTAGDVGQPVADGVTPAPRQERIAQRAYALYERRGGEPGHEVEDWLQAERDVDED